MTDKCGPARPGPAQTQLSWEPTIKTRTNTNKTRLNHSCPKRDGVWEAQGKRWVWGGCDSEVPSELLDTLEPSSADLEGRWERGGVAVQRGGAGQGQGGT